MKVHKIVNDSALEVVFDLVNDDLLAHIDQLYICQVPLVLIDGLVYLLIVPYAVPKVQCSRLWILTLIIGRRCFDFHDICHDGLFRITLRLNKESFDAVGLAALAHPSSSSLCRICSVKYSHDPPICFEPLEHVIHRSFRSGMPHALAGFVGCIEEVGSGLWGVLSAVAAHIEGLGAYRKPS